MKLWAVLSSLITLNLSGCGYNTLQRNDEQLKSSWAEVVNQYQRCADLIPNLVKPVKDFAVQEKDGLPGVASARAKVGSIQATPELLNSPGAFANFTVENGQEISGALKVNFARAPSKPQARIQGATK